MCFGMLEDANEFLISTATSIFFQPLNSLPESISLLAPFHRWQLSQIVPLGPGQTFLNHKVRLVVQPKKAK